MPDIMDQNQNQNATLAGQPGEPIADERPPTPAAPFRGDLASPSEIVPTSEGNTRYGGADDRTKTHVGVHTRMDGWREHPSLDAVRGLIAQLRKPSRTKP